MKHDVPGVEITELIHQSGHTAIYRGVTQDTQQKVIVKFFTHPSGFENSARSTNEHHIIQSISDQDGIIKVLNPDVGHETPYLILADGGISLKEFMAQSSCGLEQKITIMIQVVEILGRIHSKNIIHKDINPSNILLDPKTLTVHIIDFGISSLLTRENQSPGDPDMIEGTLLYMSPEQTGRMNRSIDYRTDFYSLGLTFYHFLTGLPPFQADDSMEIVHNHLANFPTPLHQIDKTLPPIFNRVIFKLISKMAEDRYQTAKGLIADLRKVRELVKSKQTASTFPLASEDISSRFQIPQKLYGREQEVKVILDCFDKLDVLDSQLLLVSGVSGIGKSSVVMEINKSLLGRRGQFVSGKFDQYKSDIPYFALAQCFGDLIKKLVSKGTKVVSPLADQLEKEIGENLFLLSELAPEIELFFKTPPPKKELTATEAKFLFSTALKSFLKIITDHVGALILFMDDLQWADQASLDIIESVLLRSELKSILFIGAYRTNEVGELHPLSLLQEKLEKNRVNLRSIEIRPLEEKHVIQFLSDMFPRYEGDLDGLAVLIHQKTNGNPFFISELLKQLYHKELINFQWEQGLWSFHLEKIRKTNITDNVVELMLESIIQLPSATQKALTLGACIGNTFTLKSLSIITHKSILACGHDLWKALSQGLIIPIDTHYKLLQNALPSRHIEEEQTLQSMSYKFAHDRIQQAAYQMIQGEERKRAHLAIGQDLMERLNQKEQQDHIFAIANHFNIGIDLVTDKEQIKKLRDINFQCGNLAYSSTSYRSAITYFQTGLDLLPSDHWNQYRSSSFEAKLFLAECHFLLSRDQDAHQLLDDLKNVATNNIDVTKVTLKKMQFLQSRGHYNKSVAIGLSTLNLFGHHPDRFGVSLGIGIVLAKIEARIAINGHQSLYNLPMIEDDNLAAIGHLYSQLIYSSFLSEKLELAFLIVMDALYFSLKWGISDFSPHSMAMYAVAMGPIFYRFEQSKKFTELATYWEEKLNIPQATTKVLMNRGVAIGPWIYHIRDCADLLERAYKLGMSCGEILFGTYSYSIWPEYQYFLGVPLPELEKKYSQIKIFSHETNILEVYDTSTIFLQFVRELQGKTPRKNSWDEKYFTESHYVGRVSQAKRRFGLNYYHLKKMDSAFIYRDYASCLKHRELIPHYERDTAAVYNICTFHLYYTLSQLEISHSIPEKIKMHKSIARTLFKLRIWKRNAPGNFNHQYWWVKAKIAIHGKKWNKGIGLYQKAIHSAFSDGHLLHHSLLIEDLARVYISLEWVLEGTHILREAYKRYRYWGAMRKVKSLEEEFPAELSSRLNIGGQGPSFEETIHKATIQNTSTTSMNKDTLDMSTFIKASQVISKEIRLEGLLETYLKLTMENSGAQTGHLFLVDQDQLIHAVKGDLKSCQNIMDQKRKIDHLDFIPHKVINYTYALGQSVSLFDAAQEGPFTDDLYIQANKVKSILTFPLKLKGKVIGVTYLENNLNVGVFTAQKGEVGQLLTSQAAISIENAHLYANLETKVEERTRELKKTQTELLDVAHKAGMADVASGIIHNIGNNIVGINILANTFQKHLNQIKLEEYLKPTEMLENNKEEMSQMIQSGQFDKIILYYKALIKNNKESQKMLTHISRKIIDKLNKTAEIVKAQEEFVRSKAFRVEIHMNELVEEALIKLKKIITPEIQILHKLDFNPKMKIEKHKIAHTIFQLIKNAIEALKEDKNNPNPQLIITSDQNNDFFQMIIIDNGVGIPEENLTKIYHSGFTSKRSAAGLGLHDSINFMRSLGGDLVVASTDQGVKATIHIPKHGHAEN